MANRAPAVAREVRTTLGTTSDAFSAIPSARRLALSIHRRIAAQRTNDTVVPRASPAIPIPCCTSAMEMLMLAAKATRLVIVLLLCSMRAAKKRPQSPVSPQAARPMP